MKEEFTDKIGNFDTRKWFKKQYLEEANINETPNNNLVEEIIEKLKDADLDGETIQYILEEIGMDYQMYKQLNVKYDDDADDADAMASIMRDAPDRY